MAEVLKARAALGGYARDWEGASLSEVSGLALAVVASAAEGLPGPGRMAAVEDGWAAWSAPGQWLVGGAAATARLAERGPAVDVTDAHAALRLSGPGAMSALERLCPLDLATAPEGFAARTVMEHVPVMIAREEEGWLMLTPRSSARSFLHALETALTSALG